MRPIGVVAHAPVVDRAAGVGEREKPVLVEAHEVIEAWFETYDMKRPPARFEGAPPCSLCRGRLRLGSRAPKQTFDRGSLLRC